MPAIPTYENRSTLLGRTTPSPMANAPDFGAETGAAVHNLGNQMTQSTYALGGIVEKHKDLEADRWTNDAMTELRDYYSKWSADPENHTKETFADDLRGQMAKSLADWEAKAPDKIARDRFREQFQHFSSAHIEAADITTAKTKSTNLIRANDNQNQSVVASYDTNRAVPNLDANKVLVQDITNRFASIDRSLGTIAPAQAEALKNDLVENSAYATMNYSPSTARKILKMGTLDGRRIHSIESQIKTAEEASNTVDQTLLMEMVNNRVDQAKLGRQPAKFRLTDINLYLPDDKANALMIKANAQIDTFNEAHGHLARIKSWNGPAQLEFLQELQDNAGKNPDTASKDADILRIVNEQVNENVRNYQKDSGGYLLANNPAIKNIDDQIKSLYATNKDNPVISQKMAERDAVMIKLQSPPGDDVTGDERKQYGVVNRNQIKVMSESEAKAYRRQINEASPNDAVKTIMGIINQHPNHPEIAFNNLVIAQEGEGLRGDYWLLYQNIKNVAAADLAGAIQHGKAAKEVSADVMKDFDKALDGYGKWKDWAQVFPRDNYQMEGMLSGMRGGIISYAMMRSQVNRESPELAVKKSVDAWLYSEMTVQNVGGQNVIFSRDRKQGPPLSDPEAANIAHNISIAPKYLDPDQLSTKDEFGRDHFPLLLKGMTDATRRSEMRRLILDRGFFQTDASGRMATFYLRSDTGTPFEARDKDGHAFQIDTHEVPELTRRISTFMNPKGIDVTYLYDPMAPTITIVGQKQVDTSKIPGYETMSSLQKFMVASSGQPIYATNWPVMPSWIKRK